MARQQEARSVFLPSVELIMYSSHHLTSNSIKTPDAVKHRQRNKRRRGHVEERQRSEPGGRREEGGGQREEAAASRLTGGIFSLNRST